MKAKASKAVRVSVDLINEIEKYAQNCKPRSTTQYVVEQALEEYFANAKKKRTVRILCMWMA